MPSKRCSKPFADERLAICLEIPCGPDDPPIICGIPGNQAATEHPVSFNCCSRGPHDVKAHVTRMARRYVALPCSLSAAELRAMPLQKQREYSMPLLVGILYHNAKGGMSPKEYLKDDTWQGRLRTIVSAMKLPPKETILKSAEWKEYSTVAMKATPSDDEIKTAVNNLRLYLKSHVQAAEVTVAVETAGEAKETAEAALAAAGEAKAGVSMLYDAFTQHLTLAQQQQVLEEAAATGVLPGVQEAPARLKREAGLLEDELVLTIDDLRRRRLHSDETFFAGEITTRHAARHRLRGVSAVLVACRARSSSQHSAHSTPAQIVLASTFMILSMVSPVLQPSLPSSRTSLLPLDCAWWRQWSRRASACLAEPAIDVLEPRKWHKQWTD